MVSCTLRTVAAKLGMPVAQRVLGHVQATISFQSRSEVGLRTVDKRCSAAPRPSQRSTCLAASTSALSFELCAKNVTGERGEENRYVACTVGVFNDVCVLPSCRA